LIIQASGIYFANIARSSAASADGRVARGLLREMLEAEVHQLGESGN
jgi:hypothetical protein